MSAPPEAFQLRTRACVLAFTNERRRNCQHLNPTALRLLAGAGAMLFGDHRSAECR